jgi:type IV pilus assembly protein PilY1
MNTQTPTYHSLAARRAASALTALLFAGSLHTASAALTNLADIPIANDATAVVKPNIMFILDDSGSMDRNYLPDSVSSFSSNAKKSKHCNALAYDPSITYKVPVDYAGNNYPTSSYTSAQRDGFDTAASPTKDNLTGSSYYKYTGSKPDLAFSDSGFVTECTSGTSLTEVKMDSESATQKENYANWYTYYRTRILLMKTAAGLAFQDVSDNYRVGFTVISDPNIVTTDDNKYLRIADFDAGQKETFYKKLYKATPDSSTPLRGALSKIGQLYAGKHGGAAIAAEDDPVQYSCQQNFTILSTDGYWNTGDETNDATAATNYGPYKEDNVTHVGNQDGAAPRPYFDGLQDVTTTVTTYSRYDYDVVKGSCSGSNRQLVTQEQRATKSVSIIGGVEQGAVWSSWANYGSANKGPCTSPAPTKPSPDPSDAVALSDPAPVTSTSTSGGSSDSLADVAMYYYVTDLRPAGATGALGTDVSKNNVSGSGDDTAEHQHMTTFTLGLGVDGTIDYTDDYKSCSACAYKGIVTGPTNWPDPISNGGPERIDDLWHAAVNGRGLYVSAGRSTTLSSGLTKALTGVKAVVGAAAAAATSSLEPVAGDNFAYVATYTTASWDGDLLAYEIDLTTGALKDPPAWSAQALLDAKKTATTDTRTIYTYDSTGGSKLKNFLWSKLSTTEQGYFSGKIASLSQYSTYTAANKAAATGESLVNYLRGQNGFEMESVNTDQLYRDRSHVLGDFAHSQPVYVKAPPFDYVDAGYDSFRSSNADRTGMVYVSGNDGMLHAFRASDGQELWAYVPPAVLPELWRLADANYANNHRFYVDGVITVGDIKTGGQWTTLLVGGLGKGGRAFYAMDVTDPSNPKALWNFSVDNDNDLGYSFGNPVITKLADGTWVVLVTSGYNNVGPGDGGGRLYVLDAKDGSKLAEITTGVGSTGTPSGLAKISAWVEDANRDNTALRVYGGDLEGNVWRFDINDTIAPSGKDAFQLAVLKGGGVAAQPITTRPQLAEIDGEAIVYFGTGALLGDSDLSNRNQQSLYAIKDPLDGTAYGDVRDASGFVQQTMVTTTIDGVSTRQINSPQPVNWTTDNGWYVDFPDNVGGTKDGSERVNVDIKLQVGTLYVATNVPQSDACTTGGYSWLYFFNYSSGSFVPGVANNAVGTRLGNSLVVGTTVVRLGDKTVVIVQKADATQEPTPGHDYTSGNIRRVNWREVFEP